MPVTRNFTYVACRVFRDRVVFSGGSSSRFASSNCFRVGDATTRRHENVRVCPPLHFTGSEFTTDYNRYGTLSFVSEHRATRSQYRNTGYKFKIYCNRYNFSSIIFDFTPAWSLYEYNNFIQSITGSEVTTDYSLNRHTGSEFKIICDRYYFFLSYLILIPREPLSNILIG